MTGSEHDRVPPAAAPWWHLGEVLVITPSAIRAAGWTVVGSFAVGASGWALAHTSSGWIVTVAAAALMSSVAVTAVFALQVFAPGAWTLRIGHGSLRGYVLGAPIDIALVDVRSIGLGRLLGDRALVVEVAGRRRRLLLPVGIDVAAVDRVTSTLDRARERAHPPRPGLPWE